MPILNSRAEKVTPKGEVLADSEGLARSGPVIPVIISHPNTTVPPVQGFAMIDTGATGTCFDVEAATRAGLPVIGNAKLTSASHANQPMPVFAGVIQFSVTNINLNVEKGMGVNLTSLDGNLVALIGRDVLKAAVFVYNGPDGHFSLSV